MNIISPVDFIRKLIRRNELGEPFKLLPFQEEILNLAFAFDADGKLPYNTIVYSTIKKSGKSFLNALVVLYWCLTRGAERSLCRCERPGAEPEPHLPHRGRHRGAQPRASG